VGRRDRGSKDVRANSDGARGGGGGGGGSAGRHAPGAWVALSYDPFRIEVGEGEGEREKAGGEQGGSVLVDERMSED
jgi:hypothetical protein